MPDSMWIKDKIITISGMLVKFLIFLWLHIETIRQFTTAYYMNYRQACMVCDGTQYNFSVFTEGPRDSRGKYKKIDKIWEF